MAIKEQHLKINCLVVDDESTMRQTIKNMLTRLGFKNIFVAEDGKKALDFVKRVKMDLVICDINMPNMTGLEFFSIVKQEAKYEELSFIFVTAEVRKETVARAAEKGANDYLIKPFVLKTMEEKIEKVLEKKFNPSAAEAHLKKFYKHMEKNELKEATEELEALSLITPDAPLFIYNSSRLALAKGDTDKAIELLKDVIDKQPMFVKAYNTLGEVYENLGDLESAIVYYELAHSISPANTERLIALSKLYKSQNDTEKAETILKEAVGETRHDISTSGLLMGEIYLSQNENDKALEVLSKAYKQNPSDISIMLSLAEAYRKVGQPEKAIELYKQILRINPLQANVNYFIGKAYLEMNIKDKAIENIKKAWELNPYSKEIIADLRALAEKDKISL